jgi:hypothetical protein
MSAQEKSGVRRMIRDAISRLQKASIGQGHIGTKYARLLLLLWHATPAPNDKRASIASPEVQHGAFSWLDLDAVGTFATHNDDATASIGSEFGDFLGDPNYDPMSTLFTDYRWLSDDNPNMLF